MDNLILIYLGNRRDSLDKILLMPKTLKFFAHI